MSHRRLVTLLRLAATLCALVGSGCARAEPDPAPDSDRSIRTEALHPHYDLQIDVDPSTGTLRVASDIHLPGPLVDGEIVFVLGGGQTVESARADGALVEVSPTDEPWEGLQKIVVRPARTGEPLLLRVLTQGRPATGGDPPINIVSPRLIELSLDGMWLPIRLGFTTTFTAVASIRGIPRAMTVVSGGSSERLDDRVVIRRSRPDFDFAFVAMSDVEVVDADAVQLFAADTASATARLFRLHAPRAIHFLEEWFGPYPSGPVRLALVQRERASGYARRGYVVVTESTRRGDVAVAGFVAHELAHAWSPPVDPNSEDRWLQESIAEYVALRYVEHALGSQVRDSVLAAKRERAAGATPLLGLGPRSNAELYDKGPLLLSWLEQRIGRDLLDDVLRGVAQRQPTRTAAFLAILADVAGETAAAEFRERLME